MQPPPGRPPGDRHQPVPPVPPVTPPAPPAPAEATPAPAEVTPPDPLAVIPATALPKRRGPRQFQAVRPPALGITPEVSAAFALLEVELGGRPKIIATLMSADLPPKLARFVGALADPAHDHDSLAVVATTSGISLSLLQKTVAEARRTRAHLLATTKIAERTPDLAAAIMDDAIPGMRVCETCLAAGTIAAPTPEDPTATAPCPACRGRGEVRHHPDHDVQKTALRIAGLLTDKAAVTVQQGMFVKGGSGGDLAIDRIVGGLDTLLYGQGRDRLVTPDEPDNVPDAPIEPDSAILDGNPDEPGREAQEGSDTP